VPHIGWNQLHFAQPNCPLFAGIPDGSYAYFVHSFFPRPSTDSVVASWTDYGERFASAVWKDHLFATQFHPEKSQTVGLTLLRNFHQWAG
jgi:glutamine amidotransferase